MRVGAIVLVGLSLGCGEQLTPEAVDGGAPPQVDAGDGADAAPAPDDTALVALIAAQMPLAHVPGLAACIGVRGRVAWCRGFGDANLEGGVAVTPDTPFLIASVSKTITGVALLQVWQDGAFDLDGDIAPALPFSARNPMSAATAITYRQLLTHTSSVQDNWDVMDTWYADGADPTIALGDAMARYLSPSGQDYDAAGNFYPYAPAAQWNYSNIAVALAGYLIERHTGGDFAAHCSAHIFAPLGLDDTSWRLADFSDHAQLAMPYTWTGSAYQAAGHYTFADYPSGALRTSARDLTRFLLAVAGGGALGDVRILDSATVDEMLRPQVPGVQPDQALIWFHATIAGDDWVTHSGGEVGVSTLVLVRPRDGLSIALLMNGDGEPTAPVDAIVDGLVAFGDTL